MAGSTPVAIGRGVADIIRAASVAARPQEACGLLFGNAAGVIVAASIARNIAAPAHSRFEIEPAHLFAAHRGVRGSGLTIAGCWHSHPDGAPLPSALDAGGVADRGWLWLIEAGGVIRAFLPAVFPAASPAVSPAASPAVSPAASPAVAGFRMQKLVEMDVPVVAPPLDGR